MALWKLLDYIDVYRTPLYNMMLHFIRNRVSSPHDILIGIKKRKVSDENLYKISLKLTQKPIS